MHFDDAPPSDRIAVLPKDVKLEKERLPLLPLLLLLVPLLLLPLLPLLLRLPLLNDEEPLDATPPVPASGTAALFEALSSTDEVRKVRERAFMGC